jgi:hypothetical protein
MKALQIHYPEYEWKTWISNCGYEEHWIKYGNHKKFFEWIAKELGLKKLEDWYRYKKIIL